MSRRSRLLLSTLLVLVTAVGLSTSRLASQDQPQQDQEQAQKDQQQKKKKKKSGFFGGLKAVTGQSSEQTEATATAGSKSVGEGEKIGEVTPTTADRQRVTEMEKYSVPEKDLKKFQQDGHLEPKQ